VNAVLRRWDDGSRRFIYRAAIGDVTVHYEQTQAGRWRAEAHHRLTGEIVHAVEPDLLTATESTTSLDSLHGHMLAWGDTAGWGPRTHTVGEDVEAELDELERETVDSYTPEICDHCGGSGQDCTDDGCGCCQRCGGLGYLP
jgi:hypothetical protein